MSMNRLEATLQSISPGQWTITAAPEKWGDEICYWAATVLRNDAYITVRAMTPDKVLKHYAMLFFVRTDAPVGTPEEICPVEEFPRAGRKIDKLEWGYRDKKWICHIHGYNSNPEDDTCITADTREELLTNVRAHFAELNEEG